MKEKIINYIGLLVAFVVVMVVMTVFVNYGKHLDDKAYRLCFRGIVEDTLNYAAENACLEKYGVEINER